MPEPSTILGIDLGGSKMAISLFDATSMEALDERIFPTNATEGFARVTHRLLEEIQNIIRPTTKAIGIGVPGILDPVHHTIITMPNIPDAEGVDLRSLINTEFDLPTVIENDARCFALGEAVLGAGQHHAIVVGITFGTGVGGGIVIDKKLHRGAHGAAGEFGHMLLMPGKPPYKTDDTRGDVEQFLSGTAFHERCKAAKSPEQYLEGEVCAFMRPDVLKEVAWLIVNVTHAVDPDIIIFGGSAGRALAPHLRGIKAELSKWMLPEIEAPILAIMSLKDAALRGAALLLKEMLRT